MANRQIKIFSTSLIIKEMKIKIIMRYHLTLLRMASIKKSKNNKWWKGYREKGTLLHCWWKCKLVWPLWKRVRKFLKKLKRGIPWWLSGLRIWHCPCCGTDLIFGPGNSACHSHSTPNHPREKKKNTLKIEFPYDLAVLLLGIHLDKILIQKIHAPQCS